jgi:Big-like domain-containing protein
MRTLLSKAAKSASRKSRTALLGACALLALLGGVAVAGIGKPAPATTTTTADTTPPSLTLTFPLAGGSYNSTSWSAGCSGKGGICGTASDPSGVASVKVSILQQATGKWWNGSKFAATTETFNTASGTTSWRYALSLPSSDGSYALHVRASDGAGNTTPAASQLSATFTVDTVAPPKPLLTQTPPASTDATSATFAFSDGEAGVSFQCKLDSGAWASCASPKSYSGLAVGKHDFSVRALDAAGNISSAATYSWKIVAQTSGQPFTITGTATGALYPGVTRALALTIRNPNTVAIVVTSLTVTVQPGSSNAGCDGPTNLSVTQSSLSSTNTLTVPASGQVTLPSGTVSAPQLLMKDLPTNQDACKGATYSLSYSGSAHS